MFFLLIMLTVKAPHSAGTFEAFSSTFKDYPNLVQLSFSYIGAVI